MSAVDWVVLAATLAFIILYGLYRSRNARTADAYLRGSRSLPWYAMALSIMATQASAITFISTTGQAYVDGMRFVQFYFGLPIAMVILCATAVPIFHRANVFTAYEYLEQRFDVRVRTLVGLIFLIQRGLGVGIALQAPAIVLSILFNWPLTATTALMGLLVVIYTVTGGVQAIAWTDFQQMIVMFFSILLAAVMAVWLLPPDVSFLDALHLAGAGQRLNAVTTGFDWNDRYTVWSGLLAGTFLFLAYFGTDQSQVQRYLTGKSISESRLSLLFNGMAKVPMQVGILFVGAMVFVFYHFEKPPFLFQPVALERLRAPEWQGQFAPLADRYDRAHAERQQAARAYLDVRANGAAPAALDRYRAAQRELDAARREAGSLAQRATGESTFNDTNYVFLTYVTTILPMGLVGLVMATILAAAMTTISAEINSLGTVSIIDFYRRHLRPQADDAHTVRASRIATAFWGLYAVAFAWFSDARGSLVEVVNMVGSFFYGTMLGVFVVAFYFRRIGATAVIAGALAGEVAVFAAHNLTRISFLWYNVIGCAVVVAVALAWTAVAGSQATQPASSR